MTLFTESKASDIIEGHCPVAARPGVRRDAAIAGVARILPPQ
jgi:hypothetical protein